MYRSRASERRGARVLSGVLAALAILFFQVAPPAQAEPKNKVSRGLEQRIRDHAPDDQVRVIVQTHAAPSSPHFNRLHRRGGAVKRGHRAIRGYTATIPASQIADFAADPEIERVSLDVPVQAHLDLAYPAVNAGSFYATSSGLTGRGVAVAVIDTGVQGHPDLVRDKGVARLLEVEIVGSEKGLADYYGHGTHVAGIVAGNGAESSDARSFRTFRGMAPEADIISLRALYPDGSGYTSDVIAAIDWAIANREKYNIRVINLSLGHPVYESYTTDPACRAVRAATEEGILVVVAAGNDGALGSGFGTITSPGNEPTALTVGAMDDSGTVAIGDDVLAWYSSRGPTLIDYVVKPDLVAPGTWIVSTRASGSYLDTAHHDLVLQMRDYRDDPAKAARDGAYSVLSGTSMAAPVVAGAAALMFQKEPDLGPGDVKARMMASARKDDTYLIFERGAGYLDVDAALQATGRSDEAPSPHAVLHDDGTVSIEDTAELWDGDWSQGLIWGFLPGYTPVWSAYALDNNEVTASGAVWKGGGSNRTKSTSTVDILGAIWKGGGGRKK